MTFDKRSLFELIDYDPFHEQNLFHDSSARFRIACCGRRFGKSAMVARDLEPKLFAPNKRCWICGPTYDLGEKEFRYIWDDLLVKMELIRDKRVKRAYNKKQGEMWIEFPWQTRVEVRSATKPESLVGDSLDHVILSEAAKHNEETWERYLRPALLDRRGTADFGSTPEGYNWYYRLWMNGVGGGDGIHEAWKFPSWKNIRQFPGGENDPEIEALRRSSSSQEWFDQEIGAEFTAVVGRIYPEFNSQTHVKRHKFNPAWKNYITVDWGFTRPMAIIEFQVSPNDDVYIWREWYKRGYTVAEACAELKRQENPEGYHINGAFGDSADPEAIQTFSNNYFPCYGDDESKSNWRRGIECVKRQLKLRHDGVTFDDYERPIEYPKLFVDPSCTNTIQEFEGYRAKSGGQGQESKSVGTAVKKNDHAMDAIRYGLMHVFELGVAHSLDDLMGRQTTQRNRDKLLIGAGRSTAPFFQLTRSMTKGMRF